MSEPQEIVLFKKRVNLSINNHGQAINRDQMLEIRNSFLDDFGQFQLEADVDVVLVKGAHFVFGGAVIVAKIPRDSGGCVHSISIIPSIFEKDENSFISHIIATIRAILTVMEKIDPTSENIDRLNDGIGSISEGRDPKDVVENLLKEIEKKK